MKEYLSVKEFSELARVERTTLRYWDDIGLFSPAKRDPDNNYRYYAAEQLVTVNFIKVLSTLNIPLKQIGILERERTPENIVSLIEQQEKQLDLEMRRLRENYSIIHTRRELINSGREVVKGFHTVDGHRVENGHANEDAVWVDLNKVCVLYREETAYIRGPRTEFKEGEGFYRPFIDFCVQAEQQRVNLGLPIAGLHDNIERFQAAPGEPDYFCSVDPTGNCVRPAGMYVIGWGIGYYGNLGRLAERLKEYIEDESLEIEGPIYSLYLHDEISTRDPSKYLVQVSAQVAE